MRKEPLVCANQRLITNCRAFRTNPRLIKTARSVRLLTVTTLLLFAMPIFAGHPGSAEAIPSVAGEPARSSTQGPVPGPDTQQIEVTLDEFSISPNPLRLPAEQPVTLVIRNVGKIPHEFMAGREAENDDFQHDLFAGLHVNIRAGTNGEAVPNGQMDAEGGSGHHAGDHEHGTMVVPEPGQTVHMSFKLPESRRGEWSTACFLPGHYTAGMHGTLIVD